MDYREFLEAVGLTDRRLAEGLNILIDHKDASVRVQALALATKHKGWQRDDQVPPVGATIIVVRQNPPEVETVDMTPVQAPVKPGQITH